MKSKKLRNDLILIGVILAVALIGFSVFSLSLSKGQRVRVTVDGAEKYTFDLNKSSEKTVETKWGENTVKISNGGVKVTSADCRDKICVNHREISRSGETIVCLPHKLVVEIIGDSGEN